jgi:hypothetical protein
MPVYESLRLARNTDEQEKLLWSPGVSNFRSQKTQETQHGRDKKSTTYSNGRNSG